MRVSCIPESAITLYRESLCAFQNLPLEKLATVFAYEMYRRLVSPRTRQKKLLFFLEISASLALFLCIVQRPLWERRYKSVFTSHDAIVSRSGERIVTRNFLSAIIHALCWNISFPIFLFFPTLPFSLLCTSAVDKCYCVDTLKRALFRNFLFLCFWLSASFSLWLIFCWQRFSNDDKVSSLVFHLFVQYLCTVFLYKYTGCLR